MDYPEKTLDKIIEFYNKVDEKPRLADSMGQIEFYRTKNIISRYFKNPPARVLDVGGAVGRYSLWLAEKGYDVHLVDPVPAHVQEAQSASDAQPHAPISRCVIGDARRLDFEDESADAVLLLGPLYHLCAPLDRIRSLEEAYRVLKNGGILFAVGISRFASTIDGLCSGTFMDPAFQSIMQNDLDNGQHRNPTGNPLYFMDTFFHHPNELKKEVAAAGFESTSLIAVEGIGYLMKDFEKNWNIEDNRQFLLEIIGKIETDQSIIGASPHIMCVGTK